MRANPPRREPAADVSPRYPRPRARSSRRSVFALEALESRRLLTADVAVSVTGGATAVVAPLVVRSGPAEPPDDELTPATEPVDVTGAFLTGGAVVSPGDAKAMTFDKVVQKKSDTCAFDAVLSAVALSNFDLASGITVASVKSPTDYVYNVRLFKPYGGGFKAETRSVEFDGVIHSWDAHSSDGVEFWPALYQRAYLSLEASLGQDYHDPVNAFTALTGLPAVENLLAARSPAITPSWLLAELNAGTPVVAGTTPAPDNYRVDPAEGVMGDHAYTVLGVDTAASVTYVTLRNPWGYDTTITYPTVNGLDGSDDGIIRIPWSTFQQYYQYVVASGLTGPAINHPLDPPPTFTSLVKPTYTVYAGQQVGPLDFSATDTQGRKVYYTVESFEPGDVTSAGKYAWTPGPHDVGKYTFSVFARSNPLSVASQTISLTVLPNVPSVQYITASPLNISAAGTDKLTLSASGVSAPAGTVKSVSFYLDNRHLYNFDASKVTYLGEATAASGWSLSTFVGGVAPGLYDVFGVVHSQSAGSDFASPAYTTTVTIDPAPVYEPSVGPTNAQVQASPDTNFDKTGLGVTLDSAGNVRVFWESVFPTSTQFVREFDARGNALTGAIPLSVPVSSASPPVSYVGAPDGSFTQVYLDGDVVKVQHYNAAAAAVGVPIAVTTILPTRGYHPGDLKAATDAGGDLLIAFDMSSDAGWSDVYALTATAGGTVTRAPWVLNTHKSGNQSLPAVALNAQGEGVVAWEDSDQGAIVARRLHNAGVTGDTESIVYKNAAAKAVSAAVDPQGNITLAYQGLAGIHAHRYAGDGNSDSGDFVVYTAVGDITTNPRVAVNAQGWAYVAWDDGAYGNQTLGKLINAQGRVQTSYLSIPSKSKTDTLSSLAFGDNGAIAVVFNQYNTTNTVLNTDFRTLRADLTPVWPGPYNLTVPLGSPRGTVVGTVKATDPDGDPVVYNPLGSSPFSIDHDTGVITVFDAAALASTAVTNYALTVQADDGDTAANVRPVTNVVITVVDNTPPTLAALTDRLIDANESLSTSLVATDPAGAALTYTAAASGYGSGAAPTVTVTGTRLTVTPARDYTGTFLVTATAANGLASGSRSFRVTVAAPALAFIADQTINGSPAVASVTLAGTDATGAALTYSAAIVGGPVIPAATLTITNNVLSIAPTPGYSGSFVVSAGVSDGPNTVKQSFLVKVLATPAPYSSIDIVVGTDNQIYTHALDGNGRPTGGYTQVAYGAVKDVAATRLGATTNYEAFVIGGDNQVYATTSIGGSKTGYFATAYGSIASVSVGNSAAGNPLLFAIGTDNQLYQQKFDAAGKALSPSYTKAAYGDFKLTLLTHDAAGNPLLYAVGQDGQVYGLKMDAGGAPAGGLFKVSYGPVNQLAVGRAAGNNPVLYVVGTDNYVYGHKLDASGGPVGPYFGGIGGPVKSIAVTNDAAGNPELLVLGTDSQVYAHKFGPGGDPLGGFLGTQPLTGGLSAVYAGTDAGNPVAFAVAAAPNGQVYAAPFTPAGDPAGPFALKSPGAVKKVVII